MVKQQAAYRCEDAQVMHAAVKGTRAPPRTWVLQLSRPRFNATADTLAFTVQARLAPVAPPLGACPMPVCLPRTACLRAQESVVGQGSCVCERMDPCWALVMAMLHDAVAVC